MATMLTAMRAMLLRRRFLSRLKPKTIADLSMGFRPFKFVLMPLLPEERYAMVGGPALLPEIDIANYAATPTEALSDHSSSEMVELCSHEGANETLPIEQARGNRRDRA